MTSVRDPVTREGITVGYFADDEAVQAWRSHSGHTEAQRRGREAFYDEYHVTVATVRRSTGRVLPRAGPMHLRRRSLVVCRVVAGSARPGLPRRPRRPPADRPHGSGRGAGLQLVPDPVQVPAATQPVRATATLTASRDGMTYTPLSPGAWRVDGRKDVLGRRRYDDGPSVAPGHRDGQGPGRRRGRSACGSPTRTGPARRTTRTSRRPGCR